MKSRKSVWDVALALLILATPALAQDILPAKEAYKAPKKAYSPYVGDHFPNRVLFGDTHLHMTWRCRTAARSDRTAAARRRSAAR